MSAVETTPGTVGRPRRRLLRSELALMAARRRNLGGLAILGAVPILLAIVVVATRPTGDGQGPPFLSDLFGNGLFLVLAALSIELTVFLPLAVAVIGGDAIAGEASTGTLRYLLTAPVGRTRLLVVKFASLVIGCVVAVAAVAVPAAVAGLLVFGGGELVTLSGSALGFGEALAVVGAVCGYLIVCLVPVAAIGLFLSTVTDQPIGVVVGTLLWVIIDRILGSLSTLDWLGPFLLTGHWSAWADLLRTPAVFGGVGAGLLSAAVYTAVFTTAAWARFTTKDVTS